MATQVVEVGEAPYERRWMRLIVVRDADDARARRIVERVLRANERVWSVTQAEVELDAAKE